MLFKQILLAGALQAALTSAIDVDVNGTPGGSVDRFENNHPKGNRVNHTRTHNNDHVNVDVNHQPKAGPGPTTVNGNVHSTSANVDINVDSNGNRTERFKQNHPKGNRLQDDSDFESDDEDNVNVDVNHQGGTTTVGGNVQTRSANVDINVDSDGTRADKFRADHPKGNRFQDDSDSDSDDEDNVNVDVNRQGGETTVGGNVQTRNVDVEVNADGSRVDKFRADHPKGNRLQDDSDSDSDDEDNVNVDVNHQDGTTTVGGNVQTRNIDVNVDSDGSRMDKFRADHPKGNRFQDGSDSDSDDEDNVNVDVNRQGGTTTVGGNIQARDFDINVDSDGSRADKFRADHPKGNRFQDDSDSDDEDNVNVDVNHQDGTTTVGGQVQARGYTHVVQWDDADKVQARADGSDAYYNKIAEFYGRKVARDNVDVDVTPKPNSRLDNWMKAHPSGNRVHDANVNVDVNRDHQNGGTTVGGDIQARGMGNAVFANRCDKDVWIWSVDEGGSSEAIKVSGRSRYTEPFRAPAAGGVVFKLSDSDQIVDGKHTQFEYAISNDQLYYDISFVNCAQNESASNCPGHAKGLAMYSPGNDACGKADCAPGSYCPEQSYYVDQPLLKLGKAEPVFGCGTAGTGMDLYMVVCSENPQISKKSIAGRLAWEH